MMKQERGAVKVTINVEFVPMEYLELEKGGGVREETVRLYIGCVKFLCLRVLPTYHKYQEGRWQDFSRNYVSQRLPAQHMFEKQINQ